MSRAHVLSTEDIIRMKRFLKEGDYWEALGLAPGATMRRIATRAARLEAACQEDDEAKRWVRMAREDLEHQRGYEAARLIRDEACRELQEKFGPFVFDRLPVEEVWRIARFGITELPDPSLGDQIRAAVMGRVPPLPEVELRLERVLAGRAAHQVKDTGCPICGGEGVVEQEVTVGDRRFSLPARCECVREVVFEIPRGVRAGWIIRTEDGEREYARVSAITGEVAVPLPEPTPVPPPEPAPVPPPEPAPAPSSRPAPARTTRSAWSWTGLLRTLPRPKWAWPAILLAMLVAAGSAGGFMALAQLGGSGDSRDDGDTVPATAVAGAAALTTRPASTPSATASPLGSVSRTQAPTPTPPFTPTPPPPPPPPLTPTPPPTPAPTPSEAAIAPGSLGDLDSYRYSMTMELEGLESVISESLGALTGEPTTAPETMEIEISGAFVAPDKAEIHMRISGLDDELAMTIIGNQQWVKLGDLAMGPLEFTEDISEMDFALAMWEGFSEEAGGLTCASEKKETVNDVPSLYCGIDQATFEQLSSLFGGTEEMSDIDEMSLEMWLAEDGGWPVRLRVHVAGTDESGQEFDAKLEMDITDVNEQIEIKPPS